MAPQFRGELLCSNSIRQRFQSEARSLQALPPREGLIVEWLFAVIVVVAISLVVVSWRVKRQTRSHGLSSQQRYPVLLALQMVVKPRLHSPKEIQLMGALLEIVPFARVRHQGGFYSLGS